jgi:predicted dehydrogenase
LQANHEKSGITRRDTLKKAAAFMILPAGLRRGYAANEKVDIGMIGLAGMGGVDLKTFAGLGENIVELCDVDSTVLDKVGQLYPQARKYTDFRGMIEKEKLDGVSIATPDHSHCYISVWAMKHGLHVYCQKPFVQTVHEARVSARVATQTRVITQMGTQFSAMPATLRTAELVQSGVLGDIKEVHIWTDRPVWPQGYNRPAGSEAAPSTFNWDIWLGPAPTRPFQSYWPKDHPVYGAENWKKYIYQKDPNMPLYHPFTWRGWSEFGTGVIGDQAAHSMYEVFFTLGLGAPSVVEVTDTDGMRKEMFPNYDVTRFDWVATATRPAVSIYHYCGGKKPAENIIAPGNKRTTWIGTKGSLPGGLGPFAGNSVEPYIAPPRKDWGREEVHKDWCTAIKTGKQPPVNFAFAGPFTEAYLLGNVALRVGHRIEWDPKAFRVTNCQEANQYLRRQEYRKGWDLKEIAGAEAFDV